ncbi:MAG: DUF302 domain-containing protein [Gammaproteobacteria bacterium]|nr:DUF302 domain-containing protein [Gammaproteobacteria bacterium]
MKKIFFISAMLCLLSPFTAIAEHDDGLITKKSKYSVSETLDRLENVLKKKGITVALRWKHDAKAKSVNVDLRPTELLIFGNPKIGSHMFTSNQTSGIDLPLKALAWKDQNGDVFLSYNDPAYIAKRHHIENRAKTLEKMSAALNKLSNVATGNQ